MNRGIRPPIGWFDRKSNLSWITYIIPAILFFYMWTTGTDAMNSFFCAAALSCFIRAVLLILEMLSFALSKKPLEQNEK